MSALPIIDFGPFLSKDSSPEEKRKVALEIDDACRRVGFFYLKNHGIPQHLITGILSKAREFFETATDNEKERIAITKTTEGGDNARGWLKISRPEGAHEAIDFYRPVDGEGPPYTTGMGQNKWPSKPEGLRDVSEEYIKHLETLGQDVIRAISIGLDVDDEIFLRRIDKAFWNLRLLGYEGRTTTATSPSGIGEHTDFGILTFLLTDSTKQSLQVLSKTGEWIWADPIEGCYLCNIGDMLSKWTHGAYKSTLHRVCHNSKSLRISIPFFFDPNWDAFISPVLPSPDGKKGEDEGILYAEKFVRSVDYPLWRDPLVETEA